MRNLFSELPLSIYGEDPAFEAKDLSCVKSKNTANLLNRLHNGYDEMSSKSSESLRLAIRKKYNRILLKIIEWKSQESKSQKEFQVRRELKELLSRKASYTMLCRSIPAVQDLPDEFFD